MREAAHAIKKSHHGLHTGFDVTKAVIKTVTVIVLIAAIVAVLYRAR